MYSKEQIIEKLRLGIQLCYEQNKDKVTKDNMRLSLSIEDQKFGMMTIGQQTRVDLYSVNGTKNEKIKPVKISDLFSISMPESLVVNGWLKDKLKKFAQIEQIPEAQISAHIYTVEENFYPSVRICRHGQPTRDLTIEELTN